MFLSKKIFFSNRKVSIVRLLCQLVPGTQDGFPEDDQQIYKAGPDPPNEEKYCDPSHWENHSDPPHWED